jgi:hypothetical protein
MCTPDFPFLHPAFRRVLTALTGDLDVVLPAAASRCLPVTVTPLVAEPQRPVRCA